VKYILNVVKKGHSTKLDMNFLDYMVVYAPFYIIPACTVVSAIGGGYLFYKLPEFCKLLELL